MKAILSLRLLAASLALALLAATLAWHIPFMLWDHLDFAPIYAGWQGGALLQTIFLHNHGGHFHIVAYVVLLATTWASHGQTWLDCIASWVLLCLYAFLIFAICRSTLRLDDGNTSAAAALIVFLTLYPGHLANLQWGWQVAVFLCLLGAVVTIRCLSAETLDWKANLVALIATTLGLLSFGTALALIPIALLSIVLRSELSIARKIGFTAPWIACGLIAAFATRGATGFPTQYPPFGTAEIWRQVWFIAYYVLNYLGAGIARFAPAVAPWLALLALAIGFPAVYRLRDCRTAWPWIGLLLFVALSALLTALGRVEDGVAQAFVSRYVSFSSVFWIGWTGVVAMTLEAAVKRPRAWIPLCVVAVFALVNAVAMTKRAERLATVARMQAATLCETWPNVAPSVLESMHYAGAEIARERLQVVHALGFPPFDSCAASANTIRQLVE